MGVVVNLLDWLLMDEVVGVWLVWELLVEADGAGWIEWGPCDWKTGS